jgi:heme-degrading monooxygenase HmoA
MITHFNFNDIASIGIVQICTGRQVYGNGDSPHFLLHRPDDVPENGEGGENMISRIWHGWTTPSNANKYETLLKEEIFVGIHGRQIRGFKSIQLLRRDVGNEVEFVTIMVFDSLNAVREFAGEDYEAAVVPEKARAVLSHFDLRSQHYEIRSVI